MQAPGLTSAIAHTLLESWGYEGFKAHTASVSDFYKHKRDVFVAAMERHLGGLAEWVPPESGMFLWFVASPYHVPSHMLTPLRFKLLVEGDDSEALIRGKALERGVLALPGTVFLPDGRKTAYVRASFSLLDEDQVEEACKRLGETIKAARG